MGGKKTSMRHKTLNYSDLVQQSSCPIVKIERKKFVRIESTDGLGSPGSFIPLEFEADIHWLRESTSSIVLTIKDEPDVRDVRLTYNDHYGFLTSVSAAINDALQTGCGPSRRVTVETVITDKPTIIPHQKILAPSTAYQVYNGRRHLYINVPDDWFYDDEQIHKRIDIWNNPDKYDPWATVNTNAPSSLTTSIVTWSSDNTDEENLLIFPSVQTLSSGDFIHAT